MSHLVLYLTLFVAMVFCKPEPEPEASNIQYVMAPLAATARSSQYFTRNFNYDNLARALPAAATRYYAGPSPTGYLGSGPQIITSEQSVEQIPLTQYIAQPSPQLSVVPIQVAYVDQARQALGYSSPYIAAAPVVDQGGPFLVAQEGTQLIDGPVVVEANPQGANYIATARSGSVAEPVSWRFVSLPQSYGGRYRTPTATVQKV